MDAATVVQNVGTIFAIREAVALGKPLFERYVTVTGPCMKNPGNYKVRLGSRVSDVIEECGGLVAEPAKLIMGGPMCGTALDSMDIPVVKGTSGILVLGKEEARPTDYLPCIRCGRCVAVCPAGLFPATWSTPSRRDGSTSSNPRTPSTASCAVRARTCVPRAGRLTLHKARAGEAAPQAERIGVNNDHAG